MVSISERRARIVGIIANKGSVTIDQLLRETGVSVMTIHRDLDILDRDGLLVKTRGGAISIDESNFIRPFQPRIFINAEEKKAIAKEAIKLISNDDNLILDSSTTCLALAELLRGKFSHITVITNGYNIISELLKSSKISIISTGGELRRDIRAYVGPATVEFFQKTPASKAFISSLAVDIKHGITDISSDLFYKKAIIDTAQEVILLADSSKLGKVAPFSIAPFKSISKLITDEGASADFIEKISEFGVEVTVVKVKT